MAEADEDKTIDDSDGWEELGYENSHLIRRRDGDEDLSGCLGGPLSSLPPPITSTSNDTGSAQKVAKSDCPDLTEWLRILLEGADVPLDTNAPINSFPGWLDMEKVRRGRRFAMENVFGLVYAEMLSLAILFSLRGSLEPLIYTGKSSTPFTSYQRYLRTVLRVCSWYSSDPWECGSEAQRQLSEVRALHSAVSRKMNGSPGQEVATKVTLKGQMIRCPLTQELKRDFEDSGIPKAPEGCPFAEVSSLSRKTEGKVVYVNQMDMSITQFGFMGLVVMFPRKFGMHDCTEEDLDSFVHLWRALGKLLGIEDRYNFCSGTLEETRVRCSELIERWVKPNLLEVNEEWEHMYRCLVAGIRYYVPGNTFAVSLSYLCDVLQIPMPRLYAAMGWRERLLFLVHKLIFRVFMRFSGVRRYYNKMLSFALKKARNASPEYLQKLQENDYLYMTAVLNAMWK
ncbi:uncharacterized protein LOC124161995 [Ischnura elegans]|uniref:uncharacterized protein LOC124161995 n=1 Tax=Ischnura elegans TaxID=197161 RepID=UPI001ED8BCF4|nr:uncharacterized protein LOC124161995 [Ischnura elegans]XP_046394259.1 uncharacterized protein LOC124161995 [Ischnura elegans]XP_046394260.1 uncharacterized protein LOC124161995 [Ischnura elegans]XP_046394261.1 uncharacterized protein LOC124161995 [Ischnura elegans]XP_046394262.1 uncharacterized protein LOC124161995 [Ischnura elegans]